jgi:hypothetical protein
MHRLAHGQGDTACYHPAFDNLRMIYTKQYRERDRRGQAVRQWTLDPRSQWPFICSGFLQPWFPHL